MRRRIVLALVAGFTLAGPLVAPAHAIQYIQGHILQLEPTYLPDQIALQIDAGNTACPSGHWLWWNQGASTHKDSASVYATMLAALLAKKTVDFVINDNDTTCVGQFFHIYQ